MSIPRLQLRRDLILRRISLGDRRVWVLKDPLSATFHFFDDAEFAILRQLRDRVSFTSLASRYRERLSPQVLAEFLSAATRAGILTTPDEDPISPAWRPAPQRRRAAWWKNPLAIRLPGITPRHLRRLFHSQSVTDRSALAARSLVAVIACLSIIILIRRQQDFIEDLVTATSHLVAPVAAGSSQLVTKAFSNTLLVFAIAIAITKVFHEFGHAWVCQRRGGRCREIGILLLFGVPCLYCDVSDTWLMPRRRDRILVSAAGVIAEWMIAAIAVIVWAISGPGLMHDVSALIIVVASVSTLMVNANPLLRYDGYYVLSDATGVPNLAAEANLAMRQTWAHWVGAPATERSAACPQRWLVVYAIASHLYRVFILGAIGWATFSFLKNAVGYGAALPITSALGFVVLRQRWSQLFASGPPSEVSPQGLRRSHVASGLIALGMLMVVLIPLPHSQRVGSLIRPLGERPIYVAAGGTILPHQPDRVLALDDWRLRLKELAARGRITEMESELAALRIDRIDRPAMSLIQPMLTDQIASEHQTRATLAKRLGQFTIKIASDERLFAPPLRRVSKHEVTVRRRTWTGTPLKPGNVGATLAQGTLIGRAGSPTRRTASLYVPEQAIGHIRIGQNVTFGCPGLPIGSLGGQVESISVDPVDDPPEEVLAGGWIHVIHDERHAANAAMVHYEVIVKLDNNHPGIVLPSRLVIPARIHFPATSLWTRWRKWFSQ